MSLSPRLQLGLLGGALLAVVALVFLLRDAPETAPPRLTSAEPAAAAPSADNVAPAFHTRLMTLAAQVEATPTDTTALLELARLQQDAHQLPEAASSYERLLELVPDHRQAHLDLALVYAENGQTDEAFRVTRALLARRPDDAAGLYNLGALHANAGAFDEARAPWNRVAAQTRDATLAEQARTSLAQLDALAARPGPATPTPGAPPPATPGALPPGHPTLPSLEPMLVER